MESQSAGCGGRQRVFRRSARSGVDEAKWLAAATGNPQQPVAGRAWRGSVGAGMMRPFGKAVGVLRESLLRPAEAGATNLDQALRSNGVTTPHWGRLWRQGLARTSKVSRHLRLRNHAASRAPRFAAYTATSSAVGPSPLAASIAIGFFADSASGFHQGGPFWPAFPGRPQLAGVIVATPPASRGEGLWRMAEKASEPARRPQPLEYPATVAHAAAFPMLCWGR